MGVGPTESPPYILKEMSRQVHDLRDPDLLEVHAENLSLLKRLFHSSGQTLTLASSSFSAMEAAIANLVEPGDHVLVVNSGFFSSFMAEMPRIHGGIVSLTPLFEDKPIPLDVFEECLSESEAKVVCVVHSETGTGLKMPIGENMPSSPQLWGGNNSGRHVKLGGSRSQRGQVEDRRSLRRVPEVPQRATNTIRDVCEQESMGGL